MPNAIHAAGIRLDVRAGIATVFERQTRPTNDLIRHLRCEPEALPRPHQAGHAAQQMVLFMAMKQEVAFDAE